jgi:hypothetical protein
MKVKKASTNLINLTKSDPEDSNSKANNEEAIMVVLENRLSKNSKTTLKSIFGSSTALKQVTKVKEENGAQDMKTLQGEESNDHVE